MREELSNAAIIIREEAKKHGDVYAGLVASAESVVHEALKVYNAEKESKKLSELIVERMFCE